MIICLRHFFVKKDASKNDRDFGFLTPVILSHMVYVTRVWDENCHRHAAKDTAIIKFQWQQ